MNLGRGRDVRKAGYVTRERIGRRNHYTVDGKVRMRHPSQVEHEIGELLALLSLKDADNGRSESCPLRRLRAGLSVSSETLPSCEQNR